MFLSTVIDPVWNDGRWTVKIKTGTNPGLDFFFSTMFHVFQMLIIKSLVGIFHVHHFNFHVTLQMVNHMGNVPFAQLLATSLSHFLFML